MGRHRGYCSFGTQPWSPYLPGTWQHHRCSFFLYIFTYIYLFFSFDDPSFNQNSPGLPSTPVCSPFRNRSPSTYIFRVLALSFRSHFLSSHYCESCVHSFFTIHTVTRRALREYFLFLFLSFSISVFRFSVPLSFSKLSFHPFPPSPP